MAEEILGEGLDEATHDRDTSAIAYFVGVLVDRLGHQAVSDLCLGQGMQQAVEVDYSL